jgi:hypothetical protein
MILSYLTCEETLCYDIARSQSLRRPGMHSFVWRMSEYYETLYEWGGCVCCERTLLPPREPAWRCAYPFHYVRAGPHFVIYMPQYLVCRTETCVSSNHHEMCYPRLESPSWENFQRIPYEVGDDDEYFPAVVVDYVFY